MFNKLVAIEPVSLIPAAEEKLHEYAKEVVLYGDIPSDDEEILRRIGDADAVLLSYTSRITRSVIERCQNVRYIGMCCSLYSEASANVDIACARERGIRVLGTRFKISGRRSSLTAERYSSRVIEVSLKPTYNAAPGSQPETYHISVLPYEL